MCPRVAPKGRADRPSCFGLANCERVRKPKIDAGWSGNAGKRGSHRPPAVPLRYIDTTPRARVALGRWWQSWQRAGEPTIWQATVARATNYTAAQLSQGRGDGRPQARAGRR